MSLRLFIILFLFSSALFGQGKRPIMPVSGARTTSTNQIVACTQFVSPNSYTVGNAFTYSAPTNNSSFLVGPSGANYGCLGSVPNQAWFIFTVTSPGNLNFEFSNTYGYDVDAAVWGPISGGDNAQACNSVLQSPLTCDFDAGRPNLYISNAQVGQKYVMLVTNFSNATTNISISQPSGGSVSYAMLNLPNCSSLAGGSISGSTTTVTEGTPVNLNLAFTGTGPYNYILSDGTTGQTSNPNTTITVYPTASQTYTLNTVSNICGLVSGSGSVGVSVTRNMQHLSCLPLDGDAMDTKGLNNGILNNGTSSVVNRNSIANKALGFDGQDDYVGMSATSLNTGTFSMGMWVKLNQLPDANYPNRLAFSMGSGVDEHSLGVAFVDGVPVWKFSSNNTAAMSTQAADLGWHYLAAVRSGGQLRLYVDGSLVGTASAPGLATHTLPILARIGSGMGNEKFWSGSIDDFKFFSGSLIAAEIQLLQNYTDNCNNVYNDTYLSLQSLSTDVICAGTPFTIRAISNNLAIDNQTSFVAELSDINGSFSSPTILATSTFLPISNVSIPNALAAGNYKIRLKYGSTISVNSKDIFLNKAASYNIVGTTAIAEDQSTNLTLNFTGSGPWTYQMNQGLSGVATTSPWSISVSPDQTKVYSITSASNICGIASVNGNSSATVTVNIAKQFISCFPFNQDNVDYQNNNTLSVNGPILTENRYGQSNSAYQFTASPSGTYMQYSTNLLRKREFTYSAWVNLASVNFNDQYVISQGDINSGTFQGIGVSSSGWFFRSYYGASSYYSTVYSNAPTLNQWTHVTAVRTYNNLKLYINGVLISTISNSSEIPFKPSDIGRLGTNSSTLGNYFNGNIDDVRLYKGALNDEEVLALYESTQLCPAVENAPILIVNSVSPNTLCAGASVTISRTSSNLVINAQNPVTAQLSDASGSFANPTNLGSGFSTSFNVNLPANLAPSTFYKIRLISSAGNISVNSKTINVSGTPATAAITGGTTISIGASANLNINFTGTGPWTFRVNGGSNIVSSVNPYVLTVNPNSTTIYTLNSVSNACGTGNITGATTTITVLPNIVLGSLSSNLFCAGTNISVPYTSNFSPSNGYFVQLSNAAGDFTNPVTIGSGFNSPLSCTIPANTPTGSSYKLRIITNSPSYTGPESGALSIEPLPTASISGSTTISAGQTTNLNLVFTGTGPWTYRINSGSNQTSSSASVSIPVSPITTTVYGVTFISNTCGVGTVSGSSVTVTVLPNITLNNLASNNICAGSNFNLSFNSNFSPLSGGYAVQLSDPAGSFASPTQIGSGSSSPISCLIPSNQAFGSAYKIRIITQNPAYTSPELSNININQSPTAVLTGGANLTYGQSADLSIAFTGSGPWTYAINNGASTTTSSNPATITVSPTASLTTYQISSFSNGCGNGTFSGLATVNVAPHIILGSLPSNSFCAGNSFGVPFTPNYTPSLGFLVQLSDATGSFTNPTIIGTGSNAPISVTIPNTQTSSTAYKIRVISNSPAYIGPEFTGITINSATSATISGTQTITPGSSATLNLSFVGNPPFNYTLSNGQTGSSSTNSTTISVSPATTTTYTLTAVSSSTCPNGQISGSAVVTVAYLPVLQNCYQFNNNLLDGSGNNNHITNAPGVSFGTDRFGQNTALVFDQTSDNIDGIPLSNSLINGRTYSYWLKLPSNGYINLFSVRNGPAYFLIEELDLVAVTGNNFSLTFRSGNLSYSTPIIFTPNTWNHFAYTYESENIKIYLNGSLIWNLNISSYNSGWASSVLRLNTATNFITTNFSIDDLQIFQYAANPDQIAAIANSISCFSNFVNPVLTIGNPSLTSACAGQTKSIPFSALNVTGPIKVQLSDANGNFTNPTEIGSGNTSPINALFPANLNSGTGYSLRLVSSNTVPVYSAPRTGFSINAAPTASISGTASINLGQSTNLTLNFTGSGPWTYTLNGTQTNTTSSNPFSFPVSPSETSTYTLSSVSNSTCGIGTVSGSAVITVVVPQSIIRCYTFNGNSTDQLNSGQNFTATNPITYAKDRIGNENNAIKLNQEINTNIPNTLNYVKTYSFWYKVEDLNNTTPRKLFFIGDFSNTPVREEFVLSSFGNNQAAFFYNYRGNGMYFNANNINVENWNHYSITINLPTIKVYLNGVLLETSTIVQQIIPFNYNNLILGSSYSAPGFIDDFKIFNRDLNATEISHVYATNECNLNFTEPVLSITGTPFETGYCSQSSALLIKFAEKNTTGPYKLQLSDSNGGFSNPTELRSLTSSPFGAVSFPNNLPSGNSYRMRVVSSGNQVISNLSPSFSLGGTPAATLSGTNVIDEGQSTNITLTFTGLPPFNYSLSNGQSGSTNLNTLVLPVSPIVTTNYNISSITNTCGSGSFSGSASITVNPVPIRLVSCLPMDGNVFDSKGVNFPINSGFVNSTGRSGNINTSLNSNGGNNGIYFVPNNIINPSFTYSLWFNLNSIGAVAHLLNVVNSSYYLQFNIYVNPGDNTIRVGGPVLALPATSPINFGQWYNLVLVKNLQEFKIYLNGVLLSTTNSNGLDNFNGIDKIMNIGATQSGQNSFYGNINGRIDDVQFYKGALTAGQVAALYNNPNACFDATTYTCLSDMVFNTMLNGQQTHTVSNNITANTQIQTGSNMHFDAKRSVLLQPGFSVSGGSIFKASAGGGCEN